MLTGRRIVHLSTWGILPNTSDINCIGLSEDWISFWVMKKSRYRGDLAYHRRAPKPIFFRSPSANTDIHVLALVLLQSPDRVLYDYGCGKNKQLLLLSQYQITVDERDALIGFYAVTWNDYTYAFSGKERTDDGKWCYQGRVLISF